MATLSKEEKLQIINSHMRSVDYLKYGLEIDMIQENSKSNPNQSNLTTLQNQIDDCDSQLAALNSELAAVNALTE